LKTGIVKWFNHTKGFGFIQPEDGGADAFVHISALERSGINDLAEGQRVQYELETGRNGKEAAANLSHCFFTSLLFFSSDFNYKHRIPGRGQIIDRCCTNNGALGLCL